MRKRTAILATVAATLVLTVAGVAYASIPGPDGVIHACYKTSNPAQGALIVIDSGATCPAGFAALNWNHTGPAGAQGPPGPGATPTTATRTLHYDWTPVPGDLALTDTQNVDCPTGTHAVNGGILETGADPGTNFDREGAWTVEDREVPRYDGSGTINYGLPRPVNDGGSWRMRYTVELPRTGGTNPPAVGIAVTLYALCV
jgi:hypothetical protein